MVTGFAAGYYMGTKAGRQRYDQINRTVSKLRGSDAVESAADRAKTLVEDSMERARSMVDARTGAGHDHDDGHGHGDTAGNGLGGRSTTESGLIIPGSPEPQG